MLEVLKMKIKTAVASNYTTDNKQAKKETAKRRASLNGKKGWALKTEAKCSLLTMFRQFILSLACCFVPTPTAISQYQNQKGPNHNLG